MMRTSPASRRRSASAGRIHWWSRISPSSMSTSPLGARAAKNQVANRRWVPLPVGGVQWANHTNPSGSTVSPASSFASARRRVVGGSQDRFGIVGVRAFGEVLGVDAPAGEDPRAAGERELRVTSEHQGLDAVGGVAEQHDGRRGYGRDRARRRRSSVDSHRVRQYRPSPGPAVSCPGPWRRCRECVSSRPRARFGAPGRLAVVGVAR